MASVRGVFKMFDRDKGFGFIKRDDGGRDVFIHVREIRKAGFQTDPTAGDPLQFDIEESAKGPRAVNVSST